MVQETTTQMYFRPHWKCSEQFGERRPFPASVSDGVATLNSGLLLLTIPPEGRESVGCNNSCHWTTTTRLLSSRQTHPYEPNRLMDYFQIKQTSLLSK